MNRAILYITVLLSCCLVSCDEVPIEPSLTPQDEVHFNISEGMSGHILFWEGDFMPTFVGNERDGRIYPVVRDVYFFLPVLFNDVEWSYIDVEPGLKVHLVTDIQVEPVAIVQSDGEGYFEVALPPGKYSMFVKEYGYLYANLFDGEGYIFPVEVTGGELTHVQFNITYMATY
jgi:hypothetical protein